MRRRQSTVGEELLWLLVWLALFVLIAVAMLRFVVPHHFNDRVAMLAAGMLAALIVIGLRAWYFGRRISK